MQAFRRLTLSLVLLAPPAALAAESDSQIPQAALVAAAERIDRQVATFYRERRLTVPGVVDDATFLRRAFLVSVGRIPTGEEAREFLEIGDPDKRQMLASYLYSSPGYSSHMSNWAFDLLRLTDGRIDSEATNEPYRDWVRRAMDANMPWDRFVHALLASSGDGWNPDTAAVGYYTRDRGMPLDNLSNSMRVFLGKRMECAQCHDDPFGDTDRIDFYQLAAFTNNQESLDRTPMRPLWNELREETRMDSEEYRVAQLLWDRVYGMSLGGGGSGQIRLPGDWQYPRDGRAGEVVAGRTPFGRTIRLSTRREIEDGREQLAGWVVERTGSQFAEVIANRMWQRVMGSGVYEPVDIYRPAAETHHPALMQELAAIMTEFGYDLRAFQQALMLTRTFQFAANPKPSIVDSGDDFHGRKLARLSAEQIWDSLVTLSVGNPDALPRRSMDDRVRVGGRVVLDGRKTMPELSREVLALESEAEVRDYFQRLLGEVRGGGGNASGGSMMAMTPRTRYDRNSLARASEMPSPAPRDHFLFLFGQSDREVVEASSREANVGQVLSLMNGFVQNRLVHDDNAHFYRSLADTTTDAERVRRLYISILSRPPGEEEMQWMVREMEDRGEDGVRNVVAALVMSSEFLFLQ